ncbi:MAG: hypothetical protein IPN95_08375 [Bacteroidetes bacterium]|nr:hypothetical protein [Bacteroidota bacterium]
MKEDIHPIAEESTRFTTCRNKLGARSRAATRTMKLKMSTAGRVILLLLMLQISACAGKVKKNTVQEPVKNEAVEHPFIPLPSATTFPQIHTNLNGMVREFVRSMYQDKKGNYWFGTNGSGIIRYNGQALEMMTIEGVDRNIRVMEIVEDKAGKLWFATSDGLLRYDGENFALYAKEAGLSGENMEIWGLTIDNNGLIWVGAMEGVYHFDGAKFIRFSLPAITVQHPQPMMSDQLVFKMLQDRNGAMWFVTDGNGIFRYKDGKFTHLTTQNGLTDNNTADIFEDQQGNIWIGTFNGGVSKYDGKTFTNFTQDGTIAGEEAYNFCEDREGNVWFSAEGHGVYRYDGSNFSHFTTENGLTTNVVQNIFLDQKGQIWCTTWQGICIFDGQGFVDAKVKEPWTK